MQKIEIGSRFPMSKLFVQVYHTQPQQCRRGVRGTITKTLLVVKLTILLLTTAFFNLHANSNAQSVTLSGKDITLKQVFAAIEKQTDYVAFYNVGMLADTKPLTLTAYKVPLVELLKTVFKDQPLNYFIEGKTIILSRRKMAAPEKKLAKSIPTIINLFAPPVTGRVLSSDGQPISGVTVSVKGTNRGTITGSNGAFTLSMNKGEILEVSSIGYNMLSIAYDGKEFKLHSGEKKQDNTNSSKLVNGSATSLAIILARANSPLDEVQIIAYGKTTKRMTTGNVATVTAEEIERQPVMSVLEALIGRIPGAEIKQLSGNAAAPMSVIIRGNNSINNLANKDPLYVIDGIPMSNLHANPVIGQAGYSTGAVQSGATNTLMGENPLLGINPGDIESVSVLKDADATAIYGSRGANGVILINTKKAKQGPASLTINVNNGTKSIPRYPKLLNTEEYLAIRREAFRNDGIIPIRDNAPDLTIWDQTKYTNWQKALIGTGSTTRIEANVSGGMRQSTYRISASFDSQKEIMNNGGKNLRGTFSSAIGHSSADLKFNFTINNSIALTEVNAYNLGNLANLAPNAPDIYDAKGNFNFEPYRIQARSDFPFTGLKTPSESQSLISANSVNLNYEILHGLTISTLLGFQFNNNENANYIPASATDQSIANKPFSSLAIYGRSNSRNLQVEPQIKYNTRVGKGDFSIQLISTWQSAITRSVYINARDFPNDAMLKSYNNAEQIDILEGRVAYKYLSAAAIVQYDWDRKYILKLNGRRDGSSRFGPGRQFGNFGSVGMAWIASDENWLKPLLPSWVSLLKFRGSFGITGSDAIGDYEYLSRWSKGVSFSNNSRVIYPYNGIPGFHVVRPLNQQFQWESNRKSEIGATISFLGDKINIEAAYYSHLSGQQLTSLQIPRSSGFENTTANWPAEIRNSGFEILANARIIQTKDWGLNFSFNFASNKNKLVRFDGLEISPYNGRLKIGSSTTTEYKFRYTGIDPLTGSYTFEDYNKDGVISQGAYNFPLSNTDDRYVAIETMPKFTGGFFMNLNYKSFLLNAGFTYKNGLRIDPYRNTVPGEMSNLVLPDDIRNNHWQNPGDLVNYPRYTTNKVGLGPIVNSDARYTNGSYVRLTNLSMSWRFPAKWISKVRLKNAAISVQAQNLFVITPYKGLDPEISSFNMTTPVPRTINTNLSFTF